MQDDSKKSEIIFYTSSQGNVKVEVFLQDETVWLTQQKMSELFDTTKQNISLHLNNIFSEGELDKNSVVKEYLTTANDGKKYLLNNLITGTIRTPEDLLEKVVSRASTTEKDRSLRLSKGTEKKK